MKNRLFSILMGLLITFPLMNCGLPPGSMEAPLDDPQQGVFYDGTEVSTGKTRITDIKFSPDGTRFVVATNKGILLYNTQTYDKPNLLTGHTDRAWSVSFSPDGTVLASASSYPIMKINLLIG